MLLVGLLVFDNEVQDLFAEEVLAQCEGVIGGEVAYEVQFSFNFISNHQFVNITLPLVGVEDMAVLEEILEDDRGEVDFSFEGVVSDFSIELG